MIRVLNGSLVTTTANEEAIVPFYIDDEGNHKVAGRHKFYFQLVSGSVQMLVGDSPGSPTLSGTTAATWSSAGNIWYHTASPDAGTTSEGADQSKNNIRAKGVSTFNVYW